MKSGRKFSLQRGRVGGAAAVGLAVCGTLALAPSAAVPVQAAPAPDSAGTDFWLGFPTNYSGGPELSLFITGGTATTGTVAIPGLSFSEPFAVTPGTVTSVSMPAEAEMVTTVDPETKGIHVTAGAEVTVYGLNRIQYTTDAYLGLPTDILGTEYIVLGYPGGYSSEGAVVATANETTVTITPSVVLSGGQPAGTPFTVHMDQGQTYQFTSAGDVSGTVVTADKPVGVYGGNQCANIPAGYSACDHVVEQMPPVTAWGQSFLTVPLATRLNGDTFRIVAAQHGTAVRINGSSVATLNRGEVWEQIVDGQSQITADKPILVAQYSNGTSYDGVTSDPFEMLIPPTEQFLPAYTVSTPAAGFSGNYINVVAPTSSLASVKFDGTVVPAASFAPIGSTGFSGAQLSVELGSHTVTGSLPVGVYSYGFADFDSYGYPGGMSLAPVATVDTLTLAPPTETLAAGANGCVTATVKNNLGEAVVGVRVDFARTGANPGQGFAFTDDAGHAQHCYEGANAGNDTVAATLGALTASATKTWTGQPTEGVQPDDATTTEDTPVEIFVLTNDPAPPDVGLWEITGVTQPASQPGTVTINDEADPEVEDTVVYTPPLNFFGLVTFTYTVDDGNGHTSTATVTVTVEPTNDEPVVVPGPDKSTTEGAAVQVTGTATDVDGPLPISYHWVILDGPEVTEEPNGTFADENSATTQFTPKQDGTYILQLEACDTDDLCDTDVADDTVEVTVANVAPTVTLPADRTVVAGVSTSVAVTFTDPSGDDTHTAVIDWGDGSAETTVDPAVSGFSRTHTFATTGTRTVEACVSDDDDTTCDTMTITVVAPTSLKIADASITEPDSGTASMTFTITATPVPTATVTVVAKTVNGSATAPSDFTALPAAGQTVTFAAGQATRTVTVPIVGDLLREPNESFTVTLSSPVGATIADGSGLGRIRNNDDCTVLGTAAGETLTGTAGNDVICGLGGNDTINGLAGNDTILGGDGNDAIRGGAGNDTLRGQNGDDVLTGEVGNDVIDGSAGVDEASWAGAPNAVTVDLTANTASGWGTDTLATLERARGGSSGDTLRGNGLRNALWGGDGNDTLLGRSSDDTLDGQNGNDTLRGEAGNDTALGGAGDDRVDGGAGVDLVKGDAGNDQVSGGAGNDNSPSGTTAGVIGGSGTNNLNGGLGTDYCSRAAGDTRTSCERP